MGTAGQVVMMLKSVGSPLSKTELIDYFARLASTDPSWAKSDGAITQAAYRAVKFGSAEQTTDGKFRYVPPPNGGADPDLGDDEDDDPHAGRR